MSKMDTAKDILDFATKALAIYDALPKKDKSNSITEEYDGKKFVISKDTTEDSIIKENSEIDSLKEDVVENKGNKSNTQTLVWVHKFLDKLNKSNVNFKAKNDVKEEAAEMLKDNGFKTIPKSEEFHKEDKDRSARYIIGVFIEYLTCDVDATVEIIGYIAEWFVTHKSSKGNEHTKAIVDHVHTLIPVATKEQYGKTREEQALNYIKEHL